MTGEIMFVAEAVIEVPEHVDIDELEDHLEEIGRELTIDIELVPEHD
jgi:glycine cleavage system regulatory protein